MTADADEIVRRLRTAGTDRPAVLGALFDDQRARLRRMVDIRMDPRLRERLDASDVLQDAWIEVARRIDEYLENPRMPFGLWVRFLAGQQLVALHRHHVGAQKRSAARQRSIDVGGAPEASAVAMADHLIASGTTPTGFAARRELRGRLVDALDAMDPVDREVLVLRHFEQLGNAEVATVLGLGATAASNRYVRALQRLKEILARLEGEPGA